MLLVAACHTYGEPVPSTVEKNRDFGEHPLVVRLASDEARVWSLFRGATWWLPLADAFFFQAPLPTDNLAMIGTVGGLRKERASWRGRPTRIPFSPGPTPRATR